MPPFPPKKLDFYNKKTKKNERIKTFYSKIILNTFKKFGFEWENTAIDFKFSLNLSKDEKKKKIKKMTVCSETRLKLHIDESRIWNMGMRNAKKHSYMMGFIRIKYNMDRKRFICNDNISKKRLS